MKKLVTPFRVGLLVVISAALLVVFIAFVRKGGLSARDGVTVHAYFKDASGLSKKSRVQIAGIAVGEIRDVQLEGNRARIEIRIRKDVSAHVNSKLTKRSESLLGDYVLDLYPGSEDQPLLKNGDEIGNVIDSQGMEQIFGTMQKITSDIQSVTASLRDALGGDKGSHSLQQIVDNLTRLTQSMDATMERSSQNVDQILENVKDVTGDLKSLSNGEGPSIREIVENVRGITTDVREVASQVKEVVGENEGDLKGGVASLKQTLARLDRTLANLEEVTNKVRNGEGPVGKLLTDERLGQKISETVEDVSDYANRLTKLKAEVSVKEEYLFNQAAAKTTVGVRIIPTPDKYYLLEFVDDPRGTVNTTYVQTNPPAAGQPTVQAQTTTSSALKISAEFAKRFYFATVRFGLIESTGGIGADLHFLKDDMLTLKLDAFDFSDPQLKYPRLRAALRFQAFGHFFVTGGVDDIFNKPVRDTLLTNRLVAGRDYFAGGGIYFTDDDLKSLLTVTGVPKP